MCFGTNPTQVQLPHTDMKDEKKVIYCLSETEPVLLVINIILHCKCL